MKIILRCPACNKDTPNEILPWTSKDGGFDSISVRNECCDRLEIFTLGTGWDVGNILEAAFIKANES